ncbi:MAG: hypothetical protein A2408_01015 [Candidatus Yonathbacteria bacterium RIFOXYC1_FULL_52_10]|uniref:Uncharacterized protein n=1 Tax=Candidatus Yonathbacteria bacterium RIFOXYD1_FULL_52_36 TaxID=1802730 RepID=A0A1G2SNI2_9BACT|nr:MAG: hypothetical protein A2408_01015 [Candidatus Yonathbacteria bacterium RIFOXYC1_FULL_52_10]OHA86372.1 MAG: hypothetical protein A2591_02640 [Candidatus Yonathbacteria bacterium RIFOXYD1_FULL_52_36]
MQMSLLVKQRMIVARIISVVFVVVALGGVFGMMVMEHHTETPTCVFMPGEDALCPMTVLEHLTRWQNAMTASTSLFAVFALAVIVAYVIRASRAAPPACTSRRRWFGQLNNRQFFGVLFGTTISPRAP